MPQGGRPAPRKPTAAPKRQPEASTQDWQRSGGAFSGAAKKDYLKWKRQQKAARGGDSGSDDETQQQQQQQQQQQHSGQKDRPAAAPAAHKQPRLAPASSADAARPLHYRPLVRVPAAPFCADATAPSSGVITPVAAGPAGTGDDGTAAAAAAHEAVTYMPSLDPAEVGFTPAGFQLDMPTRPRWQGLVSTAEELHALEEAEFAAWQAALADKAQQLAAAAGAAEGAAASAGSALCPEQQQQQQQPQQALAGPGLVSSYEGRLEFWRQLWRTLEMSDIVCMIVDARNPLLHFSHALYRHITQDHGLPLLLLLNKCDLLPAAAAAAWQQWLQQQLPGVTVIPVSASKEQAAVTARQVLSALLQQRVLRDGRRWQVQELVGLSLDELIQESVQRNTHAKRHLEATLQQQQQQQQDSSEAPAAAAAAAAAASSDDEEQEDWSTKPNRGARRAGRRAGRRRGQQQQQQVMHSSASDLASLASEADDTSASDRDGADRYSLGQAGHAQQQQQQQEEEEEGSGSDVDDALASLTLERRLSSTSASSHSVTNSAAAAAAAAAADGAAAAQPGPRSQPVVVGMLGEPNVGKSSTLNALLGSHRVAVSSHPGSTKHYQTHFMCDSLVLVDCPGIVFPRLNVSPAMQVLFGSSPIASCRQPYAVVRYLAEASWPRVQDTLKLTPPLSTAQQQPEVSVLPPPAGAATAQQQQAQRSAGALPAAATQAGDSSRSSSGDGSSNIRSTAGGAAAVLAGGADSSGWSPYSLCEALAVKRHWVLPRSGRLDTYRAANWLMRAALAGQHGVGLAFLPPAAGDESRPA